MANPYRTVIQNNDISQINALICEIEEKFLRKNFEWLKIMWSYKEKQISIWKFIDGKFYEKEWHKFVEIYDIKIYLMWFLRWLDFSL